MYLVLQQIQHSVNSDKNESESLNLDRGLEIRTETKGFRVEVSGSRLRLDVSIVALRR